MPLPCRVLNSVAETRLAGQIILGGATRKRLQIPPSEKPERMLAKARRLGERARHTNELGRHDHHPLVAERRVLVVEHLLDGDDVRLQWRCLV